MRKLSAMGGGSISSGQIPGWREVIRVLVADKSAVHPFYSLGTLYARPEDETKSGKSITVRGEFSVKWTGKSAVLLLGNKTKVESSSGIWLESANSRNTVRIGKYAYHGGFKILPQKGALIVVNYIPLEIYLRGVLPWEMPPKDLMALEAMKAQAVAARTYSISHLNQYKNSPFDFYGDERDQVYRGLEGETYLSKRAVTETKNVVLTYKGKPAACYYHSTCGGRTASLHEVWRGEAVPYLQSSLDRSEKGLLFDSLSGIGKWAVWKETWSAEKFSSLVQQYISTSLQGKPAPDFKKVLDLRIKSRSPSGRVKTLEIETDKGVITVHGDKTRWALRREASPNGILPSANFEIMEFGKKIEITGRGFGHGIGLCQTGAMGRARTGQRFESILHSYYPGTKLIRVES